MDTVVITFPCYALAIEPVPLDTQGRPEIETAQFYVVASDDDTAFLILFRKSNLVSMFLEELKPEWKCRKIPVETNDQFLFLLRIMRQHLQRPVGVLLDPDGKLLGYPIPPENWPELEDI